MEMTKEQIEKYGAANVAALENYKAKFLGDKRIETLMLESPKDIPIGTILTQHWLNSMTYYEVVSTSNKSVTVVEILDTQIGFDHDGGGTGTRYCMPDFVRTKDMQKKYQEFVKKTNCDIFNCKEWPRDLFNKLSKEDQDLYWDLHNSKGCSKKYRKIVKPAKNGGFYVPGIHEGFMCWSMSLWDGTPDTEYYGD